ncbi:uncharacterized protein (TIGR04222 family) [Micromonospora pisi]|uniref:Uncharacterized protein (TIGR04222 family) n=2 Tax=Micromonospora pisi TaxID=589240 RepID=A0A495JGH0_9ACTN|nr:uncharacterized protein (TIGR04222 family) [Micromonospora pisi]
MINVAAPADIWGISEPDFLLLYVAVAGVLIVAAVVHRAIVLAGRKDFPASQLTPQQAAYLNGGDRLAVYASLGGLRAAGAIGMTRGRTLTTVGPLPAGATPLDQAVYNAAGQRIQPRRLVTHQWVVMALDQLRQELERVGLAPTQGQRRAVRFFPLLLIGLLGLGVLRFALRVANGQEATFHFVLLVASAVVMIVVIGGGPKQTRAARRAVRQLRTEHAHLAPSASPAYATYGANSAAMGAALFGGAALYSLDPGFAAEAEVQRKLAGTGSGGGGCGSGCGGGSDSGGGGSDGGAGGGCGGGGGGGGGGGCGGGGGG